MSRRIRQQRHDHRFRGSFPVRVRVAREGGRVTRAHVALAQDLNPGGMSFRSTRALEHDTDLRLTLQLSTATVNVKGRVLRCEAEDAKSGTHRVGVAFHGLPMNVRDQIELHCTQHAVPLEQSLYRFAGAGIGVLEKPINWVLSTRQGRRKRVNLPARISVGARKAGERRREQVALLEEVSEGGARLMIDTPFAPGTPIEYHVPGTAIRGRGRVVFARALETPLGVSFAVGVARQADAGDGGRTRRAPAAHDAAVA